MRRLLGAVLVSFLAGCGDRSDEIPADTRAWLETRAGALAPAMTLPESLAGPRPDSSEMAELMRVCDQDPALYSYFYACLADTIGAMEEPAPGRRDGTPDSVATSP